MFGRFNQERSPFELLFDFVQKRDTSNKDEFPSFINTSGDICQRVSKGRFGNIISRYDARFPDYCANLVTHDGKSHILLEGPAQHRTDHCKRFMDVLLNKEIAVTDVIAAGDPFDGRGDKRGFLHYFTDDYDEDHVDASQLDALNADYNIISEVVEKVDGITSYKLTINTGAESRSLNVHHIPNFGDFKSVNFTLAEIQKLLQIFERAPTLAIHCSAGMGRTGVLELAYCLYANYEYFYPQHVPDFNRIREKLEELRELRPALIQTADQYRMAIILGSQLQAMNRNILTQESAETIQRDIDQAATAWHAGRIKLTFTLLSDDEGNMVSDQDCSDASRSSEASPSPKFRKY